MEETDSEVDDSIPIHQSEMYPIDFDDPPDELSDPSLILVWYTNGVAREIMTSSTWSDRIKNGWRPYFCLFKGFCACFKSSSELQKSKSPQTIQFLEPMQKILLPPIFRSTV